MRKIVCTISAACLLFSCTKQDISEPIMEQKNSKYSQESSMFGEIGSIDIGGQFAAEISAFDELTHKLFVVNNSSGNTLIDVLDLSVPSSPVFLTSINIAAYGGFVNSVSVHNGKLAAAIEAANKQADGKVVVFSTDNYTELAKVTVGALPDMVCFSPDGKLILTADEGEPNADYSVDPIGTVSIISVEEGYSVTKLDFSSFSSQIAELKSKGLRIFGPGASFAQDIEPEYVAVAANSKKAWVSLQENNAIARIDLQKKMIEEIMPLGFKNYNLPMNSIDPSDQDGGIFFNPWPVYGIYQPDAIAVMPNNGIPFIYSANEGDAREYSNFVEMARVGSSSVKLDPVAFPDAAELKKNTQLGRLNITKTLGDTDGDGDYDQLYSIGSRSFSIWHGLTGQLMFDSKDDLDRRCAALGIYPDNRSDDKGSEPEGIVIGRVGNRNLLFVGLERADAVFIYDVTNPVRPVFLQHLLTGDAPEGVHFVDAEKSPTKRSLLIVSSEEDGVVKIYSTL
jgi:DNA-binding beta-propeller fold protein YncE